MVEIDLDYFKGLSIKEILCLARKSIQITTENSKLEEKLDKISEYCNETMRVMKDDTGNNPYAQGRTIEAIRVLEIIGE